MISDRFVCQTARTKRRDTSPHRNREVDFPGNYLQQRERNEEKFHTRKLKVPINEQKYKEKTEKMKRGHQLVDRGKDEEKKYTIRRDRQKTDTRNEEAKRMKSKGEEKKKGRKEKTKRMMMMMVWMNKQTNSTGRYNERENEETQGEQKSKLMTRGRSERG